MNVAQKRITLNSLKNTNKKGRAKVEQGARLQQPSLRRLKVCVKKRPDEKERGGM
jgi:hypothetical protein